MSEIDDGSIIKGIWKIYILLLIFLYSIVIISTLLGMLSIYRFVYAVIFSILISAVLYVFWGRNVSKNIPNYSENDLVPDQTKNYSIINWTGYGLSALLLLLILVPIMNWPMSFMEKTLNWDAGLYHIPKAVELWLTGSAWDFTISYGDYPLGYETLLSFTLFFTKDIGQFSIAHTVIVLLAIIGTWFLIMRYSKLPPGIILLGIIFLILSGFLPVFNPWYFLHYVPYTIGKNDLFLAAAVISAMVFVPLQKKEMKETDWIGLGISSGLAVSIKPNCVPIILFLWIYGLFFTNNGNFFKGAVLPGMILASLGGSWIIRNLIGLNQLFLPASYRIVKLSIWSNFTNPEFYLHVPKELIFSLFFACLVLIIAFVRKIQLSIADALLFVITLISFLITPASLDPNDPRAITWRFGLSMLLLQFVYFVAVLEPFSRFLLDRITRYRLVSYLTSAIIFLTMGGFFLTQKEILPKVSEYASMLDRPYAVFDSTYLSVFDYVDENIHNSIVWIEGAQNYYAYDREISNTTSRLKEADYIVVLDRSLESMWFNVLNWDIVYQDSRGYVLKNQLLNSE